MSHVENQSNLVNGSESMLSAAELAKEGKKSDKVKKSAKALLLELEELLLVLEEAQSPSKGCSLSKKPGMLNLSKDEKAQLEKLLKDIASGKDPVSKLKDAYIAISSKLAEDTSDLENVIQIAKTSMGKKQQKEVKNHLDIGFKLSGELMNALKNGEVTIDELLDDENMEPFYNGLTDDTHQVLTGKVTDSLSKVLKGKPGDDKFIEDVVEIVRQIALNKTSDGKNVALTLTDASKLSSLYKLSGAKRKATLGSMKDKASAPAASKGSKPSAKGTDFQDAIFELAMCLQTLLSSIYHGQVDQNNVMNKVAGVQAENAKTLLITKIKDIQDEIAKSAQAKKKPWWMYLIAIVLVIAGAALAAFTGGASACIVALVIGGIMASPLGDMITSALVKAIAGPNPTEAGTAGATVAATAIITLIVTILSCGAAGISTAVEGAAQGAAEGAESAAINAGKTALTEGGEIATETAVDEGAQQVEIEMVDMTGKVASKIVKEGQEESQILAEDMDSLTSDSTSSSSSAKPGIRFDKGALTKGLLKRFIGQYIQGFVGSGGLTSAARAIMLEDPAAKKWLHTKAGAIIWAGISVVVAIVGSLAGGKLAGAGGAERAKYLKGANLKEAGLIVNNNTLKIIAQVTQVIGGLASGGASINKFIEWQGVADAQKALAKISAQSTMANTDLQTLQNIQKAISSSAGSQEKHINDALQTTLNTLNVEGKNAEQAMTS